MYYGKTLFSTFGRDIAQITVQGFQMDRTQLWKQISGPFVIIKCHFAWLEQEIGMSLDVINKEDTNENSRS